jgi:imidazolonepropionase-like amidohydrolase
VSFFPNAYLDSLTGDIPGQAEKSAAPLDEIVIGPARQGRRKGVDAFPSFLGKLQAMVRILYVTAALAAALVMSNVAIPNAQPQSAAVVAFTGARLIDGTGRLTSDTGTLVVRGGRIEAAGPAASVRVPAGARTEDLGGRYVVPGFIATHVHVSDINGAAPRAYTDENTIRQLRLFAQYGVTTVVSLGGEQAPAFRAREMQQSPALTHARLLVAGEIVTAQTPDAARTAVARVAATRPDFIKIRVDDNLGTTAKMSPETYRAVIEEAHRHKIPVAAHLFYLEDAKGLLRAGVDMIAHSVRDKDIDDEFIALMRARNVPYVPTLTREMSTFIYEAKPAFFDDPFFLRGADPRVVLQLQEPARQQAMRTSASAQAYKAALVVAERNVKRAADAGLLIAMGTDSGSFPERFQGYFEHLELVQMAHAGLTPAQILKSATGDAARALRRTDVGTLAPGAWADMLVLEANPLDSIANTQRIHSVWVAGNRVGQ